MFDTLLRVFFVIFNTHLIYIPTPYHPQRSKQFPQLSLTNVFHKYVNKLRYKNVWYIILCIGDMTGEYSVYTIYEGHEIMFHVSTMLPYSKDNRQQVNIISKTTE